MISRVWCCLLVLSAAAAAYPPSADAQGIVERLKAKARQEAVRQTEELLRNAVRCVASDSTCVVAAKAAGKPVVLTDTTGQVLTDADGQPITDPRQLPEQQPSVDAMTAATSAAEDGRFTGSATNRENPDGSGRAERASLDGSASVGLSVSNSGVGGLHELGYLISLRTEEGQPVLTLSVTTVAPGSYEIGQQVVIDGRGYGPPRGSLHIESAADGILVGSVNVTFPTAYRPGWGMEASFRAGLHEPDGRTVSYEPSHPLGLDNLLAAIADLPAAKQNEIRRVYDEALIAGSGYGHHDPGCLAQAYLVEHRSTPIIQGTNSAVTGLPFHECIVRDHVAASRSQLLPEQSGLPNGSAVAAASTIQRIRYRNCLIDGMTDVWIESSIASGGNERYASASGVKALDEFTEVCKARHLSP